MSSKIVHGTTGRRAMRPDGSTSDEPAMSPEGPTVGDNGRYEFKSVQAIRGTGAKTIVKWRKAGWSSTLNARGHCGPR